MFPSDPRGVLGTQCQPGDARFSSGPPLHLDAITGDISHEFDSAWKLDARVTYRVRNTDNDIYGEEYFDRNVAVSHPVYGELRGGTQLSRAWSRADAFTYPLGITSPWSETGAGFGLFHQSLRYTAAPIELPYGKLVLEATYATNRIRFAHNATLQTYNEAPPRPKLGELFVQFANETDLIEYTFQGSQGGTQYAFGKGAFVGDVGNADNLSTYVKPHQNVHILEGDHYFTPQWKGTWGLKRSYWSGEVTQCDFVASIDGCYFSTPGFNYASDGRAHSATEWDAMAGLTWYHDPLWTYTIGMVRLNKAYTRTPTEYGQSNTATFVNMGAYRRVPEIYKDLKVYGGLGFVRFGRQGPAPLSMPAETADGGVDPRAHQSAVGITLGAQLVF